LNSVSAPTERLPDQDGTHLVEVVWDRDLAGHESPSLHGRELRLIERRDFDDGLAGLGDNEWPAPGGPIG
jgi:hypothetical protein